MPLLVQDPLGAASHGNAAPIATGEREHWHALGDGPPTIGWNPQLRRPQLRPLRQMITSYMARPSRRPDTHKTEKTMATITTVRLVLACQKSSPSPAIDTQRTNFTPPFLNRRGNIKANPTIGPHIDARGEVPSRPCARPTCIKV